MPLIKSVPFLSFLCLCLLLDACASGGHAPVVSPADSRQAAKPTVKQSVQRTQETARPADYTVKRGDTLYSIAWNYGLDYRHVAGWNGIRSPYTIYPGQKIRLQPAVKKALARGTAPQKKAEPLTPGPITKRAESPQPETTASKPVQSPQKQETVKPPQPRPEPLPDIPGPGKWLWPADGKIVKMNTPISKNGIDITGAEGQGIRASAPGEVVYSGSGLRGYGRLIIIKHNDTYLSAYAHNKELLVKEGDRVTSGQKIAHMGRTSDGRTLLHFEIRKNGQPVNPLSYLPKR